MGQGQGDARPPHREVVFPFPILLLGIGAEGMKTHVIKRDPG